MSTQVEKSSSHQLLLTWGLSFKYTNGKLRINWENFIIIYEQILVSLKVREIV